jgi:hypothetical protein
VIGPFIAGMDARGWRYADVEFIKTAYRTLDWRMMANQTNGMRPLVYRVTKHMIANWVPFFDKEPRGIAYETNTHFVHFFGKDKGLWVISAGLTATEGRSGSRSSTLREWIDRSFGAVEVKEANCDVGHTIVGVWRPGLYFSEEVLQGLSATTFELRLAEQALLLLIQRLDELLHFVEPSPGTLRTHSHKARELLILACTEVENAWKSYLRVAGSASFGKRDFTTNDYVKLLGPLYLAEYQVLLPRYADVPPIRPFHDWSADQPTKSLPWYDAYNKTKHDRSSHFTDATLWNCLQSVAANLVLFSVRFGPFHLFHGGGTLAAYFNQLFTIELKDCSPESFYAPKVELPPNQRGDLICFNSQGLVEQRIVDPLKL